MKRSSFPGLIPPPGNLIPDLIRRYDIAKLEIAIDRFATGQMLQSVGEI